MRILEKTLVVMMGIGVIFKVSHLPGASMIMALSFMGLASVYFYLGFLIFNGIRLRQIFKKEAYNETSGSSIALAVIVGILASIALVGVLFDLLLLPGAQVMLLIGSAGLLLITVWFLIGYFRSGLTRFTRRLIARILPVVLLSVTMYLLTDSQLIEIYYRRYPKVTVAYKALLRDRSNPELQLQLDEAIDNMKEERSEF